MLFGWVAASDYSQIRGRVETGLNNLAITLEKDIARNAAIYDGALQQTVETLGLPGLAQTSAKIRSNALFGRIAGVESTNAFAVFDPAGDVLYSSYGVTARTNCADREYFQVQRDQPDAGLYVSKPLRSRFDESLEIIAFSRRVNGPDGRFAGVVAGALPLRYFHDLFSSVKLGKMGAISLMRTDGTLIARFPDRPGLTGRNFAGNALFGTMLRSPAGLVDGLSVLDGVERIYAYRRVGTYPLVVIASGSNEAAFEAWWFKTVLVLLAAVSLIGLSTALHVALRKQIRRRSAAERLALASAETATRSKHALAEAFDHLDVLFQNSADIHFGATRAADGRFLFDVFNRRGEELTGVPAAKLLGRGLDETAPPALAAETIGHWERCVASGQPISYELTAQLPVGLRHFETLLVPVRNESGTIFRLIGTSRDITARKQAEQALIHENITLEQRAAEADVAQADARMRAGTAGHLQVLGQLASGIAHDFNNVLQSVSGCAAIIERDTGGSSSTQRAVRLINDAASRGSSIIERLLNFARTDKTPSEPILVAPMLSDLAEMLRHTLRRAAVIEIVTEVADECLSLHAERNQLQTVLINLATNARDAMPRGGTIRMGAAAASALPDGTPGGYLRLWVQDDGIGMAAETLARATEAFFTTKPIGQGTGLGLSMANTYAKEAGGVLALASAPGSGTTVTLYLRR